MTRTLIIGYGNPLRGDDGVGWAAAEHLADVWPVETVEVLAVHQLTPDLAATVRGCDQLILIDATKTPTAERVCIAPVIPEGHTPMTSSHQLLPGELLACAQQLFGATPAAWLVTVRGESFEFSDQLSPPVLGALRDVIAQVRFLIESTQ